MVYQSCLVSEKGKHLEEKTVRKDKNALAFTLKYS